MTNYIEYIRSKIQERDPAVIKALAALVLGGPVFYALVPTVLTSVGAFLWALVHVLSAGLTLVLMAGGAYITFCYLKNKGIIFTKSDKPPQESPGYEYIDVGTMDIPGQAGCGCAREAASVPR